jgi:MraZ protein
VNFPKGEKLLFRGQFTYSIDSKGRISIPAKLRKQLSPEANDTFVMNQGIAKCIDIYPLDQWIVFEQRLEKLNHFKPEEALFTRMILQNAHEDTLDSQSRILLPQNLIEYAQIEKEVLILGVLKKIEVWNPKVYEEYIKQSKESYEQIAAKVMS